MMQSSQNQLPYRSILVFAVLLLGGFFKIAPAPAQSIQTAIDGTGTVVTQTGSRFDISGGSLSADEANLFHSFQQFGLDTDQVANFLINPNIRNILGRVVGEDPSVIQGLIQLSGGDANLLLMNPAGIMFGETAQLDLPGTFMATTATGIGLDGQWFNAVGENSYSALVGNPSQFAFTNGQLGSILNEAALTVADGQNLTLLAGTVINTGTLSAPGGTLTIAAVPEQNIVRITQAGSVLKLEMTTARENVPNTLSFDPLTLPELLTGSGAMSHATTVTVAPDGALYLTGTDVELPLAAGTAVVSGILDAAKLDATHLEAASTGWRRVGGEVNVLGDQVGLLSAHIDVSGTDGGGVVRIGGDYQGQGGVPNAAQTFVSQDTMIAADAVINGDGGRIIVWADDTTQFFGTITATGGSQSGHGGFAEVSGKENLVFAGEAELSATLGQTGTLLLDPQDIFIVKGFAGETDGELSNDGPGTAQILFAEVARDGNDIFTISEQTLEALDGNANVELQARDHIVISSLEDNLLNFATGVGDITFTADADGNGVGDFTVADSAYRIRTSGRDLEISGVNLTLGPLLTSFTQAGGDVTLVAQGNIVGNGPIDSQGQQQGGILSITSGGTIDFSESTLSSLSNQGRAGNVMLMAESDIQLGRTPGGGASISSDGTQQGGNVRLTSNSGSITVAGALLSLSQQGLAGDVTLSARHNINLEGDINSLGENRGGNILIGTQTGALNTEAIALESISDAGTAGDIRLSADQDITTGLVDSHGQQRGGNITLTSNSGQVSTNTILNSISEVGTAGEVIINAKGDIMTSGIRSEGELRGGRIMLMSTAGKIQTTGQTASFSTMGRAGDVIFTAAGNINLHHAEASAIRSDGYQQGGQIRLTSRQANIMADTLLSSLSEVGIAGDVSLSANDTIVAHGIDSHGYQQGGKINLASANADIQINGNLDSFSENGVGGLVQLAALGNITTKNISTVGLPRSGDVNINSAIGSIMTANILTEAVNGVSGNVTLSAYSDISTQSVISDGIHSGNISITSDAGEVRTREVFSSTGKVRIEDMHEGGIIHGPKAIPLNNVNANQALTELEEQRIQEFSDYFGRELATQELTPAEIGQVLVNVEAQTDNRSVIVYVNAHQGMANSLESDSSSPLELLVFTAAGQVIKLAVPAVDAATLFQTIEQFRAQLVISARRGSTSYLEASQRLYQWLIAPIEAELGIGTIDTFLFSMDVGLRSLPIAALHDGEQFLVEKYSVGMVPSIGLMNTQYQSLAQAQILAMGASTFETLNPLPAVSTELDMITHLWAGNAFLNESFTRQNLTQQRQQIPYQMIHLATHAEFNPGTAEDSYIQLWHDKLRLSEVDGLGWDNPSVDLLVLSACRTAVGNPEAEMGFAGLAIASGVRSALASLWSVSDVGTLALMTEFYDQLRNARVKSVALQAAQLAMLRGETRIEGGQLHRGSMQGAITLPPELGTLNQDNLSHPYYWSGFTMIGSPW
ncbi:MAG: CHAT domain-containing protein [Cyanothece sp. SIO1E1]|nr:CHAT domain-containing protein [Cyanothece sp. SIO1E1]